MSEDNSGGQASAPEPPELTPQKLLSLSVFGPATVDRLCEEDSRSQFLVEGLLPARCIGMIAGDSGIGKSPLAYQLAICVAAGVCFLGMRTEKCRVLYCDLENSLQDSRSIRNALVIFLELSEPPENFFLTTEPPADLPRKIEELKPGLVIIDTLRSFRPDISESNDLAGAWLKSIRQLARKHHCVILFIHHLRKPDKTSGVPDLVECNVTTWLLETEGARALVNQTDVRIAVAEGDFNPAAMKLKWSRRVYGDSPPYLLERMFDGEDEPAGYRKLAGAGWLSLDRRLAFERLPNEFGTKEAKAALQRSADPTNKFLKECIHLGILEKLTKGRYRKLAHVNQSGCPPPPQTDG
jgi:hypothetical protein